MTQRKEEEKLEEKLSDTQKRALGDRIDKTADAVIDLFVEAARIKATGKEIFGANKGWQECLEMVHKEWSENRTPDYSLSKFPTLYSISPVLLQIQTIVNSDEFRFSKKDDFWKLVINEVEREGQYAPSAAVNRITKGFVGAQMARDIFMVLRMR